MAGTVEEELRDFLAAGVGAGVSKDELTDDFLLIESGVVDSMAIFQLVEMIEDTFGVEVMDDELSPENFESISTIARLVRSKSTV